MKKFAAFLIACLICAGLVITVPQPAMAQEHPKLKIEVVDDTVPIEEEEVPLAELQIDHSTQVMKQIKTGMAVVIVAVVLVVCGGITVRNKRRDAVNAKSEAMAADDLEQIVPVK